jgi:hypothetical protein
MEVVARAEVLWRARHQVKVVGAAGVVVVVVAM